MQASTRSLSRPQTSVSYTRRIQMLKNPWFKLASRIACLAVLTSAALWLNASARGETSFSCILAQNTKNGAVTLLTCGTSQGDAVWSCPPGGGTCDSDPGNDWLATMCCNQYATE